MQRNEWKRKNPDRASDWIAEEKERHTIQPPADNSDLLKGESRVSDTCTGHIRNATS